MHVAVGEGPSQVCQGAMIDARRYQCVRVLGLTCGIRGANDRCAQLAADRLRPTREFGLFAFLSLRNGHRKSSNVLLSMPDRKRNRSASLFVRYARDRAPAMYGREQV